MRRDDSGQVRVFLVEDHPMFREQVAQVITQDPRMTVCGEADNMRDGLRLIEELQPDIAIVDLTLRGSSGVQLIKALKSRGIRVPVLVLSMHDESVHAERLLWAGARGFVCKSETSTEVKRAIERVLAGGIYLSESMTATALQKLTGSQSPAKPSGVEDLSDRELEVFRLLGLNYTSRDISKMLGCSESTVNSCRFRIRDKLGIRSTVELYKRALDWVSERESSPAL